MYLNDIEILFDAHEEAFVRLPLGEQYVIPFFVSCRPYRLGRCNFQSNSVMSGAKVEMQVQSIHNRPQGRYLATPTSQESGLPYYKYL
jgi:hypothetical protein